MSDERSALSSSTGNDATQPLRPRVLPPCPARRPQAETDFHKLMNDFDTLLNEASTGKYANMGGVAHPEYLTSNGSIPRSNSGRLMSPGLTSTPTASLAGTQEGAFFRGANFVCVGGRTVGTPNSRASSSTSSTGALSEGRLGSAGGAVRLAPLEHLGGSSSETNIAQPRESTSTVTSLGGHRSLLGLLTSKLRRQPLTLSPRPHSVPVDIADYQRTSKGESLIIADDDSASCQRISPSTHARPATTGVDARDVAANSTMLTRGRGNGESEDRWADQKSALDKEKEEIAKLQEKREEDRRRREEEREQRRLKRQQLPTESTAAPEASNAPAQPSLEDERIKLVALISEDLALLRDTENAARETHHAQEHRAFSQLMRDHAFEHEKIHLADEARHKLRLQKITERGMIENQFNKERERMRRWEIVRDTVVDEEQARNDIVEDEDVTWNRMLHVFFDDLDGPFFSLEVEERLTREEFLTVLEHETFLHIQRKFLIDLEALFRRRLDRTWTSWTASNLTVPILLFNHLCVTSVAETSKRRQIYVAREIEHGVLWERFCDDIHPLIDRNLWKIAMTETNKRVELEQEENDCASLVYHGCTSSRELVTRYASIVRESNARRAQQREEAMLDILEDELAERLLLQRDEREGLILIEEMGRRDVDAIRTNIKKRQIDEAMKAAEQLRLAEVQRLVVEEDIQKRERAIKNQQPRRTESSESRRSGVVTGARATSTRTPTPKQDARKPKA